MQRRRIATVFWKGSTRIEYMRFPFFGRGPLDLDWVQFEVTSRCNASCRYCPRRVYASHWLGGDLDFESFRAILPELRPETLVHLQGWGEPLLHPRLADMVSLARERGHPVATTSNGLLLDGEAQRILTDAGLNILGLSLVGIDRHNDRIREGSSARQVLNIVESMASRRDGGGEKDPSIHIAFLLLRSELSRFPECVRVLSEAGVDRIVVSSLDFVPSEELLGESFRELDERGQDELNSAVMRAEEAVSSSGTELFVQLALDEERSSCPENGGRSLYVGFDGGVFPCVMAAIPAGRPMLHYGPRGPATFVRESFGQVPERSLGEIWRGRQMRRFRRGVTGWGRRPDRCVNCAKLQVQRIQSRSPDTELIPRFLE